MKEINYGNMKIIIMFDKSSTSALYAGESCTFENVQHCRTDIDVMKL
jgi:hypothetical protein